MYAKFDRYRQKARGEHGERATVFMEAHQRPFAPAFELAISHMLWPCLDDHERVELRPVRAGYTDAKRVDAGHFRRLSCFFMVTHLSRKGGHLRNRACAGQISVSETPKRAQSTGQSGLSKRQKEAQKGKEKAEHRSRIIPKTEKILCRGCFVATQTAEDFSHRLAMCFPQEPYKSFPQGCE